MSRKGTESVLYFALTQGNRLLQPYISPSTTKGALNQAMPAILIVDDNPIQGVTRRLILEKAHFPVVLAENGEAALAKFESGDQFGMIITDHCMPGMTGPELVKKLREQSALPILVLSGMPEAELQYEGMDVHFRLKPIQPEELISLSRTLLFPPYCQTA
jgi:CheY-like chemotaxis protein